MIKYIIAAVMESTFIERFVVITVVLLMFAIYNS